MLVSQLEIGGVPYYMLHTLMMKIFIVFFLVFFFCYFLVDILILIHESHSFYAFDCVYVYV